MRYCLVQDGDCHWYLIPANMYNHFINFLASDISNDLIPNYAERIDNPFRITFENPKEE